MQLCTDTHERLRTCTGNVLDHFRSYRHENKSIYRVLLRVEFDGDVRFFLAPPKSIRLSFSIDFFDVFCNLFVFQVFVKILIFFPHAAAEQKSLPQPRRFYELVLHMGV